MQREYDIEKLNPRKNPYSNRLKKQVTINIDTDTIDYFKTQSETSDCAKQNNVTVQHLTK